jgi:hypothetical protein
MTGSVKSEDHSPEAGVVVQAVDCLPSKHEALSSTQYHQKKIHICNPSHLGGGDQEGHGSRTAWARSHLNQ